MKTATFEEVFTKAGIIPKWIEEGRGKGREEGLEEGEKKIIDLLKSGKPPEEIIQDYERSKKAPKVKSSKRLGKLDLYHNDQPVPSTRFGFQGWFPGTYFEVLLRANPKTFLEVYKTETAAFEEVYTKAGIIPQWVEKGIEKGQEEGLEEGEKKIIDLLKSGKSPEEIIQNYEDPKKTPRKGAKPQRKAPGR